MPNPYTVGRGSNKINASRAYNIPGQKVPTTPDKPTAPVSFRNFSGDYLTDVEATSAKFQIATSSAKITQYNVNTRVAG